MTILVTVAALAVLLGCVVVARPLLLLVDEGAVPPVGDRPALPDGVVVDDHELACGSGGCAHQWTVVGPADWSADEVAASLGLEVGTDRCEVRSLLDRRRVCSALSVVGDELRLFVRFDRPFD